MEFSERSIPPILFLAGAKSLAGAFDGPRYNISMRFCMFCGGRVSSREHAWPLWLLRRVGADKLGEMNAERGGTGLRSWHLAKSGVRVRFVCIDCNNVWMSELEFRAKPVIEPLLDDVPHVLAAGHQRTLAVWAVKSAMVFEALRLNQPWVSHKRNAHNCRTKRSKVRLGPGERVRRSR
jgi:hypothetical protein